MALVRSSEQEDVYVVCWTDGRDGRGGYGGMLDPFKQKLHQPNVEDWLGSGQTKWVYDDFDPMYGLVRGGSPGTPTCDLSGSISDHLSRPLPSALYSNPTRTHQEGDEASSILDWERRMIVKAVGGGIVQVKCQKFVGHGLYIGVRSVRGIGSTIRRAMLARLSVRGLKVCRLGIQ